MQYLNSYILTNSSETCKSNFATCTSKGFTIENIFGSSSKISNSFHLNLNVFYITCFLLQRLVQDIKMFAFFLFSCIPVGPDGKNDSKAFSQIVDEIKPSFKWKNNIDVNQQISSWHKYDILMAAWMNKLQGNTRI